MQKSFLIHAREAQEIIGVANTRFYELVKRSDFPKPTREITKRPMYFREEIEDWVRGLKHVQEK